MPTRGSAEVVFQASTLDEILQDGQEEFQKRLKNLLEASLGESLPSGDICFENLHLSAQVAVNGDEISEIPTLFNALKDKFVSSKGTMKEVEILKGISGSFRPGTATLLLGQPKSGKSSLMKVLSGRFPMTKTTKRTGDITYNGIPQKEIESKLPRLVRYVDQQDYHYSTLTVLETFQFAHACCTGKKVPKHILDSPIHGSDRVNQTAVDITQAFHRVWPEFVVQTLGLENCKDTIVGDGALRGVSGGEKKRVTTGEMAFGYKFALLMDEISTGLDSAATFDIVKGLRSMAHRLKKTVVISLLQPPPEVFELFDEIMLLGEGMVMYHGPRDQLLPYMETLGYQCPPRVDVADFLLDLGTEKGKRFGIREGIPSSCTDFANAYHQSELHRAMLAKIDSDEIRKSREHSKKFIDSVTKFSQPFVQSTMTLLKRGGLLLMRNKTFLIGRMIMVLLMGTLYGTTFAGFDPKNVQVVIGVIFVSIMFIALGQASQVPTFMEARRIFYKQRGANFFSSISYVASASALQIPVAAAEAILFGSLVYWLAGFVQKPTEFLIYELTLFLTNLLLASFFFFISAIAPDMNIGLPLTSVSILLFVIFAGFVVTKNLIPDYFIWIYWIDPIAWGIRTLAVNQYSAAEFQTCVYEGIDYCKSSGKNSFGEYALSLYAIPSESSWVPFGLLFLSASYVFFIVMSTLVLEYKRYETPESSSLAQKETHDEYEKVPETPRHSTAISIKDTEASTFTPLTLSFINLWYSVPKPGEKNEEIDLLKGVSGYAKPGTMTALMGSSGAGKTTLMDVIAGRKTGGRIRGQVLLNGYPATELALRRCTGYCEQTDVHSEAATVREALAFSAFLRQSSDVSDEAKRQHVEECIRLLELEDIADKILRGMSTEEMKRVTIGVELAAQPGILFLDEPTSGLDARAARVIMNGVRKVANSGRTIVCTIHQPSTEIFGLFDNLLLLKRGGETVYFGELGHKSSDLVTYFEAIETTKPIQSGHNPATWMLEVIGAGVGNDNMTNYAHEFNTSSKRQELMDVLAQDGIGKPSSQYKELKFSNRNASTGSTQLRMLLLRCFKMHWRTPTYNLTRFMIQTVLALLFGSIYNDTDFTTFTGINSGVGMVFLSTVFMGVTSVNSVMPLTNRERTVYYRERAAETYKAQYYFLGHGLTEIPYVFSANFIFCVIFYFMVGFTGFSNFLFYWFSFSLFVLMQVYFGQFMAFALPTIAVAALMAALINSIRSCLWDLIHRKVKFLKAGYGCTISVLLVTHYQYWRLLSLRIVRRPVVLNSGVKF